MENVLPTYAEFVKLEKRTLKLLYDYLSQWPTLSHSAGMAQKILYDGARDQFLFDIYWDICDDDKKYRILLGEVINKQISNGSISNMTSYFCIVEGADEPKKILRKFHFDYVTPRLDRVAKHPRFHLQYCGGLTPAMQGLGVGEELMEPLEPFMERPRIFFRPMTLGLLMNIVFHEFPCNDTEEIRKRGEWLSLVRENEKRILVPFYKICAQLAGNDKFVFFDEAYV